VQPGTPLTGGEWTANTSTTYTLKHLGLTLVCSLQCFAFRERKALCHLLPKVLFWNKQQSFYGPLSGTTQVSRYQKKHSPIHRPNHHPIFISFFHLRSIASSLFKLCAWQSFCTTSLHVLFGLRLVLEPSTSYSIHFFTQSVSSFRNTCPYHCHLFCCSIKIISSTPSLSVNSLLGTLSFTLTICIHLTILFWNKWGKKSEREPAYPGLTGKWLFRWWWICTLIYFTVFVSFDSICSEI